MNYLSFAAHLHRMRREIIFLLWANNLWLLGEGMLGPLFAVFSQRIGGDLLQITWAWSVYMVLTGLLIILVGRLSDRVGPERLMVAGFVLNALFTFAYLLVDSQERLLIVQVGLAVAAGLATPTWDSLYTRYQRSGETGYLWGMHMGQGRIVTGVAIVIGGVIVNSFSFATLFAVMGILQVVATFSLMPLLGRLPAGLRASRARQVPRGRRPAGTLASLRS